MLVFNVLVTVVGGLGVFLLGMKNLSEGLQAVGGASLRRFMGLATTNRMAGVGTGIASTMIVQSSSVITVMLVGFVSSGMMTLGQAINVLIGANIGTTGTVWIVAFAPSPETLGLAGLAIGGICYFFVRRDAIHDLGLALVGLGLVFLGLYFMSKGVMPIRHNPGVQAVFTRMEATNLLDVAAVSLVSLVFTAVIQSSAAAIAIAMTLASQQLITYEMAVSVLFGANIGTTATAWLAAIGGPVEARRTALAHTLSNAIGSILFLPLVLPVLVPLGKALFPHWDAVTETAKGPMLLGVMAPIAVTDTIFSVLRGVALFPFATPFARLVERLMPAGADERPHLGIPRLGARFSPVIACDQVLREVQFMRDSDLEMLRRVRAVLSGEAEEADCDFIVKRESRLDALQGEVTDFLGRLLAKRMAPSVAARARRLLRLADELESVSDEAATILKSVKRLRREDQDFSDVSRRRILALHDSMDRFAGRISPLVVSPRQKFDLVAVQDESSALHEFVRNCRQEQLARIGPGDPSSAVRVLAELDIINAYERIRAYYLNVAETLGR
ncbi:MAG: Na/Pi cotransporter family protein [Kiritimatiellae bacterium]|nr:Na/Pi cotransporter family protein [Kiritimatiellia bacterium]